MVFLVPPLFDALQSKTILNRGVKKIRYVVDECLDFYGSLLAGETSFFPMDLSGRVKLTNEKTPSSDQ